MYLGGKDMVSMGDLIYDINSELLKFVYENSYNESELRDFIRKSFTEKTKLVHNSTAGSKDNYITDYKAASGPQSFGRHLLTRLWIESQGNNASRKEEYGEMFKWQKKYDLVLDDVKSVYGKEYDKAVKEFKHMYKETQRRIKEAGIAEITLYRNLSIHDYEVAGKEIMKLISNKRKWSKRQTKKYLSKQVNLPANIISSYTTDSRVNYSSNDWSNLVIKIKYPVEQIIYHGEYLNVPNFGGEEEILVYNPKKEILLTAYKNFHSMN